MKRLISILGLLIVLMPVTGSAAVVALNATLNSSQEVPPSGSNGIGSAAMLYDTESNQLSWAILYTDLTGPLTGAHFHGPAPVGSNAGVQVDIGAISGLVGALLGSATLDETQEADLLNDLWYINLHTAEYPGGEIRGQVYFKKAVPIPAAVWLMGSALMGLVGLRRRS